MYAVLQHNAANETQAASAFPVSAAMSNYCTTARQGAKNDRDYGARHPVLRDSIVLHHGCVLAYGQRAPRAPHRKCRESVAGILTEKSLGDVAARTLGSNLPRIRTGYVVFFKKLFSDRPPASDSRGALQSLNVRNRRTRILLTRGVIALLRPPARQPLLLARSEYTCAHSCLRCNSLFAPAQAGRVALMLLPAHVLHAFCNLLIGR